MIKQELLMYLDEFTDKEQVLLFLLSLRHANLELGHLVSPGSLFKLVEDGIVERDYISSRYSLLIPFYTEDDGSGHVIPQSNYSKVAQDVKEHIDDYRLLFKGARVGSMGNKQECINRMITFLISHNTTLQRVIDATMYYLEKENPEYIMNADNFISNERGSKLAIVMDELPEKRLL